jgi:preprotein translocase subunit YajC
MSKKSMKTTSGDQSGLKIGSRVRCTEDGVTGRIAWANAVSVKIKWDDGEEVTWKRDSLATRPIEILDADDEPREDPPSTTTAEEAPAPEQVVSTEQAEPVTDTSPATTACYSVLEQQATVANPMEIADATVSDPTPPAPEQTESTQVAMSTDTPEAAASTTPKRERKAKAPADSGEKKMSALDAAARVLAEAGQSMTCKEIIEVMGSKGYWTSPGGLTPDATLYSAILRELSVKGADARFQKTERGKFARTCPR